MPAEPIVRHSVVDVLVERLRTDILDGTHEAGSLLPSERELAASYGVTVSSMSWP